ncbi:hypothetical protein LG200_01850 [Methylobacillus caricis]|uniref:hypothetical protein n=1 Tax=Methylobacillus caricis TaxID=1971611 RepID=UPI001D001233|nr:hypothetical protein [Methylobacillus caricis]MCB5186744.1 hypothetical protein [Methylobacillus caricis]
MSSHIDDKHRGQEPDYGIYRQTLQDPEKGKGLDQALDGIVEDNPDIHLQNRNVSGGQNVPSSHAIPGNKLKHAEEEGHGEEATQALKANTLPHETEHNKPIKPDPEQPYQPTEPDEPDVQPEIIDENNEGESPESKVAPAPEGFVIKENIR